MKKKILRWLFIWLPVIFWAGLIFHFSSGTVPVTSPIYWQDFAVKKTGHAFLFGILSVLIYRALRSEGLSRKKAAVWAIILSTFYGATDEFHQLFTQGREARIRDVFIDGFGAALVITLIYYVLPKFPPEIRDDLVNLIDKRN